MSQAKETFLNGAYSPLPPSTDDQFHSTLSPIPTQPRRRNVLRFVIPVTLALCLATFALGLVAGFKLRPGDIHVYASGAKIKEFNLINDTILHCKVELALVFRNPNRRASVRYKSIQAVSFYEGNEFGSVRLSKFHQGCDSSKRFDLVLEGKSVIPMNWSLEEFYRVKEKGFVGLEVRAFTRINYKIGFFKTKKRSMTIVCVMNRVALALATNATSYGGSAGWGGFRSTRCGVITDRLNSIASYDL